MSVSIAGIIDGSGLDFFADGDGRRKSQLSALARSYASKASYLLGTDAASELYPAIGSDSSPGERARYIHDMQLMDAQLHKALSADPASLKEAFAKDARLAVSLNNYCNKGCLHCIADSTQAHDAGEMEYWKIISLDRRYFDIFARVDFGRTGDPMLWASDGRDISDIVKYFSGNGVKEVTLAVGLFKGNDAVYDKVLPKLERVHDDSAGTTFGSMITYHHYLPGADAKDVARLMNKTITGCARFSDKIAISILADRAYDASSAANVRDAFRKNFGEMFDGLDFRVRGNDRITLYAGRKKVDVSISPVSDAVYPFGRFKKTLERDGTYDDYAAMFSQLFPEPSLCPDVLEWPGMVIEANGDINMCGSFEAIAHPNASVVSNVLKPFDEVEKDMLGLYDAEKKWFLENFQDVAFGRKSTCKILNGCYGTKRPG